MCGWTAPPLLLPSTMTGSPTSGCVLTCRPCPSLGETWSTFREQTSPGAARSPVPAPSVRKPGEGEGRGLLPPGAPGLLELCQLSS